MSFSSSRTVRASPGSPGVDCRGARLVDDLKRMLPLPPLPPRATTTWSPGCGQVLEHVAVLGVDDHGAGRDGKDQVLGRGPVAIGPGAALAAGGLPLLAMGQGGEAVDALLGHEDHAAAVAAVAAVGAAARDVFLPAEADAAVTPVARLEPHFHFVNKHKRQESVSPRGGFGKMADNSWTAPLRRTTLDIRVVYT